MKKLFYLLTLLIFSQVSFAQTITENYVLTTTYKAEYDGGYQNYTKNLYPSDLFFGYNQGSNGNDAQVQAHITITNNILTFEIQGQWNSNLFRLKTGSIAQLPPLQGVTIELGELQDQSGGTGYFAKIQNGTLYFYNPNDQLNAEISTTISTTIVSQTPYLQYGTSNLDYEECFLGTGSNNSGFLAIQGNTLTLDIQTQLSQDCNIKLGQIHLINIQDQIQDIELGYLINPNGQNTDYQAKIENNWLVFYSDTITIPNELQYSYSQSLLDITEDDIAQTITYYDGLGRPKQKIIKQGGGNKQDIITPIIYDNLGRQDKDYLSYANPNQTGNSSTLNFRPQGNISNDLLNELNNRYLLKYPLDFNGNNINTYSEKVFESSPLNRVIEQSAPGSDWAIGNNHTTKYSFSTNSNNDEVKQFSVSHINDNKSQTELIYNSYYLPNQLYKTIKKNENHDGTSSKNNTIEDFINKEGNIILKRHYNNNTPYDTYYVYDDFGNLTYVIPPKASYQITTNGYQGFRVSSQVNYPWVDIVNVDKNFALEYNKKLEEYENQAILNVDIENEYGGQGGFTITTLDNSELVTLSINISAIKAFQLKLGEIASLKSYGNFKDSELGQIGNYVFLVKNNTIVVENIGRDITSLSNISQTFNNNSKLTYSYNYPWTNYTKVNDSFAENYESQLKDYPNNDILGVSINNEYGGQGGLNISVDENDVVSVTINSSTITPLELKQGFVIPLNLKRPLENRVLGVVTGNGYSYELSIEDNSLSIKGEGLVSQFNGFLLSPPLSNPTSINPPTVDGLCYIYHYDYRKRVVEKKIPGKGWEYIVYDKFNRPILTQDAKMRLDNKWLFTKYDNLSRVVYTGVFSETSSPTLSREELQTLVDSQTNPSWFEEKNNTASIINGTTIYYSNISYPSSNIDILTINYFDSYIFDDVGLKLNENSLVYDEIITSDVKSLNTGTKVRVLDTNDWITTVTHYNDKAKPIYIASKNSYLNTTDISKYDLDFDSKIKEKESTHTKGLNSTIVTVNKFDYDHSNRLLTQIQTINGSLPELIVNNHYDELGQLITKNVGGNVAVIPANSQGLQTIDYSYNIRGWINTINDGVTNGGDIFGFALKYNNPVAGIPLFNGNISEFHWQTANDNNPRSYDYSYDALNRLKSANYHGDYALTGSNSSDIEDFSVSNISYDKNGNIGTLKRKGYQDPAYGNSGIDFIDDLVYTYAPASNKLINVNDNATRDGFDDQNTIDEDYVYDINGNLIKDKNKKITSISYNHLNLPIKIEFDFDENPDVLYHGIIEYVYDATGVKLSKNIKRVGILTRYAPILTLYSGNFVYKGNFNEDVTLKYFNHSEGYVKADINGLFRYVYQFKDHLGNVRLSYSDTDNNGTIEPSTEILEEKNYYPFGLKHKGYNNVINGAVHPYGFGGKEEQNELGLNWVDITARNYDPAIGRWMNLDPLAESMRRHSPYNYAFDNPIFFMDPDGMAPNSFYNTSKNFFFEMIGDADALASSQGKDSRAKERLAEKSEMLSKAAQIMAAYEDSSESILGFLPYGEELAAAGKGVVYEDMTGAAEDYLKTRTDPDNLKYEIAGAILPFVDGGDLRTINKVRKKVDNFNDVKRIGPAGDAGAKITKQIPDGWTMKPAKKGAGTRFSNPNAPPGQSSVRVMRGNVKSPNVSQQVDYVKHTKNGVSVDKYGKPAASNTPEAHIPLNDFNINN